MNIINSCVRSSDDRCNREKSDVIYQSTYMVSRRRYWEHDKYELNVPQRQVSTSCAMLPARQAFEDSLLRWEIVVRFEYTYVFHNICIHHFRMML